MKCGVFFCPTRGFVIFISHTENTPNPFVSLETNFLRRQRARRPRSQGAAAVKHLGRKIFLGTRAEEPTCSTVAKRSPAARVFNDHTCGAL